MRPEGLRRPLSTVMGLVVALRSLPCGTCGLESCTVLHGHEGGRTSYFCIFLFLVSLRMAI